MSLIFFFAETGSGSGAEIEVHRSAATGLPADAASTLSTPLTPLASASLAAPTVEDPSSRTDSSADVSNVVFEADSTASVECPVDVSAAEAEVEAEVVSAAEEVELEEGGMNSEM